MTGEHFDAIVLGTGQAGKPLALDLAAAGRRTAVVERAQVGGTCVNVGCTPTKTMAASARVAYLARRAADYGVHCGAVAIDLAQVRRRKQAIVEQFRTSGQRRLEEAEHVDLIFGEGRFIAAKVVEVALISGGTRTLTADTIIINTGCRPRGPRLPDWIGTWLSTPHRSWSWTRCRSICSCWAAAMSGWSSGRCFAASAAASPWCSTARNSSNARIRTLPRRSTRSWKRTASTSCSAARRSPARLRPATCACRCAGRRASAR